MKLSLHREHNLNLAGPCLFSVRSKTLTSQMELKRTLGIGVILPNPVEWHECINIESEWEYFNKKV